MHLASVSIGLSVTILVGIFTLLVRTQCRQLPGYGAVTGAGDAAGTEGVGNSVAVGVGVGQTVVSYNVGRWPRCLVAFGICKRVLN